MSIMQTIILTALPQRIETVSGNLKRLSLNVFITPRLRQSSDEKAEVRKLSEYPDWADWTNTLKTLKFKVLINGAPPAGIVTHNFSPLNSKMWSALFPKDQSVKPFIFRSVNEMYERPGDKQAGWNAVEQFSTGTIHKALRKNYSAAMRDLYKNGKLPTLRDLSGLIENPASADQQATKQAQNLLTSESDQEKGAAQAAKPNYDFHERVSLMNDYSRLLPMLGLVVNLSVEVLIGMKFEPVINVELQTPPAMKKPTTWISPFTFCLIDPTQNIFTAKSRDNSPIVNGCLNLADKRKFEIIQTDALGGMFKYKNALSGIEAQVKGELIAPNIPTEQGLPALQNAGLQIIRKDALADLNAADTRAIDFQVQVDKQENGQGSANINLFADDITLGYRFDVFDVSTGKWRSLHQYLESFAFADKTVNIPPDFPGEGFIQPSMAAGEKINPFGLEMQPFISDVFCAWDGWSLSVPKPGAKLAQPPGFEPSTENSSAPDLRFSANYKIKSKSLPKLRFGREYKLRVRTVDLAGESAFVADDSATSRFQKDITGISDKVVYQRFAPILPPAMIYKSQKAPKPLVPIEGESLERMVVRSDLDKTNDAQNVDVSERFFVAPKSSQTMIELHGKLDTLSTQEAYERSVREYATLIYTHQLVDQLGNQKLEFVEVEESPGVKKKYLKVAGARKIERSENGKMLETYWVQDSESFKIPYLPDPLAKGIIFRGLPGIVPNQKEGLYIHPFLDKMFPEYAAVRLRLKALPVTAAASKSEIPIEDKIPTVHLKPGETIEVLYNSFGAAADLPKLGLCAWMLADGYDKTKLEAALSSGEHAGLTPYRKLTLVHAVKQPLKIPSFSNSTITPAMRQLGSTDVNLSAEVAVDRKSTSKVDVFAEWTVSVDPGAGAGDANSKITGLTKQPRKAFVGAIELKGINPNDQLPLKLKHEIGDTMAHNMTYSLVATTAFREYFDPDPKKTPPGDLVRPTPSDPNKNPAEFKLSFASCQIKSTRRPDAPKISHVLPTFLWKETAPFRHTLQRTRTGNGLRVYLERPWFTSGDDEMLAVVLTNDVNNTPDSLLPYVSQWGADPIHEIPNNSDSAFLQTDSFAEAAVPATAFSLKENSSTVVKIAACKVQFDPEQGLWFSDIIFAPTSKYFPFAALALARYQPNAENNAELSSIVRIDPIQILPNRTASVKQTTSADKTSVSIKVEGNKLTSGKAAKSNIVQAVVEKLDPKLGSDFGWTPTQTVTLSSTIDGWTGDFSLSLTADKFRLRLTEYELYNSAIKVPDAKTSINLTQVLETPPGTRIVYTDLFSIN